MDGNINILEQVKALQASLDQREVNLNSWEEDLLIKEQTVNDLTEEYLRKKTELDKKERELFDREATLLTASAIEQRNRENLETIEKLRQAKIENIKKENDLFDIKANLDQREADITRREIDVTNREQTYKDTLKTEFIEELKRKLG